MKPYYKYANDVIQNKIVCCSNIKLACQRFQEDLNRDDLEFRESVVDRAISFISTMKHFKGKASGKSLSQSLGSSLQQLIQLAFIGTVQMTEGLPAVTQKYLERMERQPQLLLCAYIFLQQMVKMVLRWIQLQILGNRLRQPLNFVMSLPNSQTLVANILLHI